MARFVSPALFLTALTGAAAAAGGLALAADWLVDQMTAPTRPRGPIGEPNRGFTPFETGVRCEDVTIAAEDGTLMTGWLFFSAPTAPTILACGGYRGRRADLLGISSALWRDGFNVLLFDYRGHGDFSHTASPNQHPVTLGYRELADARAALRFLQQRFPSAPLGVIGFSMGAAIALMVAAREPAVKAIIADSPFTTQRDIVRYRLHRHAGRAASRWTAPIGDAIVSLADRRLRQRLGFRFADVEPLRDVTRLTQPLFLIHGERDLQVPPEHSRRLAAAATRAGVPLETWFVPDATHCDAYFLDRPLYCTRAATFFRRHLTPDVAAAVAAGAATSP